MPAAEFPQSVPVALRQNFPEGSVQGKSPNGVAPKTGPGRANPLTLWQSRPAIRENYAVTTG